LNEQRLNAMWITLPGSNSSPRLTAEEIEVVFQLLVQMHDHGARMPARPVFWVREETSTPWRFSN